MKRLIVGPFFYRYIKFSILFLVCWTSAANAVTPSFDVAITTQLAGVVSVAVGDLDKDGHNDIIATTKSSITDIFGDESVTRTVQFLAGHGNGTFAPAVTIWSKSWSKVARFQKFGSDNSLIGDFNGDGTLDFVFMTDYGVQTSFLGKGDGTFQQLPDIYVDDYPPLAGDVNHDGKLDIIYNSAKILFGNGDGTFRNSTIPTGEIDTGCGFVPVAFADFNGDGIADFFGDCDNYMGVYSLWAGQSNGGVSLFKVTQGSIYTGADPKSVWGGVGDFNGDGFLDSLKNDNSISFGRGDGTFGVPIQIQDPPYHYSSPLWRNTDFGTVVADFNLDGYSDFVVIGTNRNQAYYSSNNELFAFAGASSLSQMKMDYFYNWYPSELSTNSGFVSYVVSGDMNNDGKPDLVTVHKSSSIISVYLNTTNIVGAAYRLNVAKSGTGSGTISSDPTGINCGITCSADFNSNANVTLSASTAAGSTFSGWSGDCSGFATCVVSMSAAKNVTASFTSNGSGGNLNLPLTLAQGWNLLGNSLNQALPVSTTFSDPIVVTTLWKWDLTKPGWQFYAPSMDAATLLSYATSKGYGVLSVINPGEGYWVNAKAPAALGIQTGAAFSLSTANLVSGWNLVATGKDLTPSAFNISLSETPPATGVVPINLTTLWAWNNALSSWYFYAPSMEANGGLLNYIMVKNYLDFTQNSKTLGNGVGFWVNKP